MTNQEIRDTLLEMSADETSWNRQEALLTAAGLMENTLMAFLRDEVPFRLTEILGVEYPLEPEIETACRNILFNESDQIFNYDKMDELLGEVLDEYQVPHI